jgi:23S rRNA (cytidine2498-2'-O)-methyltransferase
LTEPARLVPTIVAQCRAGFEPEAATDLRRLASAARSEIDVRATAGYGHVVGGVRTFESSHWQRALERFRPVFVRALFVGTGPHSLLDPAATRRRPDRVAPLTALVEALRDELSFAGFSDRGDRQRTYGSLRIEMPDTNEGKALSGLARALEPALTATLRSRGLLVEATAADASNAAHAGESNLHVFLVDGAHAFVGVSVPPWASRWPMGIPRLRMPGAAPSRSTLKLAEAIVTFLGDSEAALLRPGMRAVDLGAAPGGWTWQLAYRGLRVTAVDNGPLKGSVRDDPLVTHLRADGLNYLPNRPVDWMTCDIAEQPARIATLVARWIGEGRTRHAIFNLKLPMKKRYDEVDRCAAIIGSGLERSRARHRFALRQLYHDREEVTGCVTRLQG